MPEIISFFFKLVRSSRILKNLTIHARFYRDGELQSIAYHFLCDSAKQAGAYKFAEEHIVQNLLEEENFVVGHLIRVTDNCSAGKFEINFS